jgi:hypothetical protein
VTPLIDTLWTLSFLHRSWVAVAAVEAVRGLEHRPKYEVDDDADGTAADHGFMIERMAGLIAGDNRTVIAKAKRHVHGDGDERGKSDDLAREVGHRTMMTCPCPPGGGGAG